jgi:hypothetical protein
MHSFGNKKGPKHPAACARRKSEAATLLNAAAATSCDCDMTLATMGHTARGPAAIDAAASAVGDATVQREKTSGRRLATIVFCPLRVKFFSEFSTMEKGAAQLFARDRSGSHLFVFHASLWEGRGRGFHQYTDNFFRSSRSHDGRDEVEVK